MPKREDEYFIGLKKTKGKPLCPYCGSEQVYPRRAKKLLIFTRTLGWSCANEKCRMYRKIFPSPSYGPGK